MSLDTLELGKLLVSEIPGHGSEDILMVWLMHYVAELITKAERGGSSASGQAAKKETCETILKIWEHRASLSGLVNPMKQYESALRLLHKLSNDGYFIFGRQETGGDPIEEFQKGSATLLSSLLVLLSPDDAEDSNVAVRNLSKLERTLMREIHVIRVRRIVGVNDVEEGESTREALKRDIREDVARVRKSLEAIELLLAQE